MPVLAMHMLVSDFLSRCRAYIHHFDDKAQGFAAQRVVAVQQYRGAFDLGNEVVTRLAIRADALDLAADLHAGREVRLGHGGDQGFVAFTEGVFGSQFQRGLKSRFLAFQRGFQLGEQVVVIAVQVRDGLLAIVVNQALAVGNFHAQGDSGVGGDFHGEQ